jgi:uncharacterized membrane protein YczE
VWKLTGRKSVQLLLGLVLYGVGMALIVRGELGVTPWDVLTQGLMNVIDLNFGLVTLLVSIVVFALWVPLRQRPGAGTIANLLVIPIAVQVSLWLLPVGYPLWARIVLLVTGILAIAVGSGLYIGVHLGPGPRDGLMTGLHERTGWPIGVVRTLIEVSVVGVGWMLGGNLGIGTVIFAFGIGPLVQIALSWFSMRQRTELSV